MFGKIGIPELIIFTILVVLVLMFVREREASGKS